MVRRSHVLAALALAASVQTASFAVVINGFSGFAPVNKTVSGNPSLDPTIGYSADGSTFNITNFNNSESTTGFYASPVDISSFTASFTYTPIPGTNGSNKLSATGIGFNILNAATGSATNSQPTNSDGYGVAGVATSTSVLFNNYGGFLNYGGSTQIQTGGSVPNPGTSSLYRGLTNLNLSSGDPLSVAVTYSGGTIRESVTDTVTGKVFKTAYIGVNLPANVGASTAFVGFSGTTGGYNSTNSVSNFTFTSGTGAPAPAAIPSTAVFTPIAVSGFNKTIVVPASATAATATSYINTSVDKGADYASTNSGFTFFEKGMAGSPAGTGLPTSGSTFTSAVDARHTFTMPQYNESGTGRSDSLLLDYASASGALTFAAPTPLSAVSVLLSAGHGPVYVDVVANYADGSSADLGDLAAKDWFFNTPYAYSAGARLDAAGQSFGTSSGNINLYQYDLALPASGVPVTGLSFLYDGPGATGGDNGTAIIFAVSGAAVVPEPTSLALLACAAPALLSRRRR